MGRDNSKTALAAARRIRARNSPWLVPPVLLPIFSGFLIIAAMVNSAWSSSPDLAIAPTKQPIDSVEI
jgi:hypothetical protein